jgi:hypothetical protein
MKIHLDLSSEVQGRVPCKMIHKLESIEMRKFLLFVFLFISPLKAEPVTFNNLTILVCSCDKYSELWSPFFTFLFNQWPSLKTNNVKVPILLIANGKSYSDPRVTTICAGEDKTWTGTLLKVLSQVKTDYVLILLEDYFINAPVNEARLLEIFEGMQREKAAYVQISCNDKRFNNESHAPTSIPGTYFKPKFGIYRPSLQAALWDKKQLEWLTNPAENVWEFEVKGNSRSQGMAAPFLSVVKDEPIHYLNAVSQRTVSQRAIDYCKSMGVSFMPKQLSVDSQHPIYFWYTRTFQPAWKSAWDSFKGALGLAKKRPPLDGVSLAN